MNYVEHVGLKGAFRLVALDRRFKYFTLSCLLVYLLSDLVGGLEHLFIFPYIGFLIIPIDFHIFQRGGPTTNQKSIYIHEYRCL